ncbi:MAG TPA: histidine kinase [Chloroflexota bacterium]|nr:histidine kinase [Chloroflexota bacterium]
MNILIGHGAFLPLRVKDRAFGTLVIAHVVGGPAFTEEQLRLARTFADQAYIAGEYGRARMEAERLSILDDRARIARELHDGIIQSLFAVGMGLQGTAATLDGSRAGDRRVRLTLARSGTAALLTIEDGGRGFDTKSVTPGQGLGNLKSRITALGGRLRITSTRDKGTRVRIRLKR